MAISVSALSTSSFRQTTVISQKLKNTGALCRRSQLRWVAVGFASALVALSALVAASREDVVYNKYGVKVTP